MAAGDIVRWISNTSGAWSLGTNWDTGAAPSTGEIAMFDGTGLASVLGGDESLATALGGIIVEPGYTGNIGASGSPLIHNVSQTSDDRMIIFRGAGDLYFQGGGAGLGKQNYSILVDSPGSTVVLDGDANSEIDVCYVKAGTVTVSGGVVLLLHVSGLGSDVTLNEDATDPVRIKITGGLITSARTLTGMELYIDGGKFLQTANMASCNITVAQNGILDYRPTSTQAAPLNDLFLDGILDYRNAKFTTSYRFLVIGRLATIIGTAKEGFAVVPTGPSIQVDLRENYPE